MSGCITLDVLYAMISLHSGLVQIDKTRLLSTAYKWVAIDATGVVFAYKSKPTPKDREWMFSPSVVNFPKTRLVGRLPLSSPLVRDWKKSIFRLVVEQSA